MAPVYSDKRQRSNNIRRYRVLSDRDNSPDCVDDVEIVRKY